MKKLLILSLLLLSLESFSSEVGNKKSRRVIFEDEQASLLENGGNLPRYTEAQNTEVQSNLDSSRERICSGHLKSILAGTASLYLILFYLITRADF